MEEINHIWTTQGTETPYRLSVVYEFALVPIEPLDPRIVADPPRSILLGTNADMAGALQDFVMPTANSRAFPVSKDPPYPTSWLPVQLLVQGGSLVNKAAIGSGDTELTFAVSGPVGETVALEISWATPGGAVAQPAQVFPIVTAMLDSEDARHALALAVPNGATAGEIRARPALNGKPIADSPFGNVLTLTVA
jgi:hypothetical protein